MFCATTRRRSASVVYLPTSSRSLLTSSSDSSYVFLFSTPCFEKVLFRLCVCLLGVLSGWWLDKRR